MHPTRFSSRAQLNARWCGTLTALWTFLHAKCAFFMLRTPEWMTSAALVSGKNWERERVVA